MVNDDKLINQLIKQTDRAPLLSHSKFHKKNLRFVIDTLLNNDYPLNFIFDTINKKLKYHFKKYIRSNNNNEENTFIHLDSPFHTFLHNLRKIKRQLQI